MTLHLTSAEWERIAAAGSGVLFRAAEPCPEGTHGGVVVQRSPYVEPELEGPCELCRGEGYIPPAEFEEAAAACETCEGHGYLVQSEDGSSSPCDDGCLDGKRRVAVVVSCETCGGEGGWISDETPTQWVDCRCENDSANPGDTYGLLTVGHVVVTFGPLVVRSPYDTDDNGWHQDHVVVRDYCIDVVRWTPHRTSERWAIPPDVDPQTLVGQWAIGVEVVS